MSKRKRNPICPYCGSPAVLRPDSFVHKDAGRGRYLYVCSHYPECDAYVSANEKTRESMGILANGDHGFIRKGQGFTGEAALQGLFHEVYLVPVRLSLWQKAAGFLRILSDGYPLRIARHIFSPDRLSGEEKDLLNSISVSLSLFVTIPQVLPTAANLYLKRMVVLEGGGYQDVRHTGTIRHEI